MKKIFALLLVVCVLLLSSCAFSRADPNDDLIEDEYLITADDSFITIDFIKNSTWCELVNLLPSQMLTYESEDYYCKVWIEILVSETMQEDLQYVNDTFGGIKIEMIDSQRLIQKFNDIVQVYNSNHELQLVCTPEILNDVYMQIEVHSTNLDSKPITRIAQTAKVKVDTFYWESSFNFGSGKHYTISKDTIVTVNGVSYLDLSGNIEDYSYFPYKDELKNKPSPVNINKMRMLHICIGKVDLGWVDADSLMNLF